MITSNNCTLFSLIELVEEFFDDKFYDDEFYIYANCKEDFCIDAVFSCLKMPEDFYTGVHESFTDWWEEVLYGHFCERDCDSAISYDEVADGLGLKYQFFEKSPKNAEELSALAKEFRIKRKYYELSRWLKWSTIECEEVKSKFEFIKLADESSAREWVDGVLKEYDEESLHISDFDEFGFEYGVIVAFDSVWRLMNSPIKL